MKIIKERIKELNDQIIKKQKDLKEFDDLPLSVRIQPENIRRRSLVNESLLSLQIARQMNDDILKGRLTDE